VALDYTLRTFDFDDVGGVHSDETWLQVGEQFEEQGRTVARPRLC
jgi:hypothetical protein